MSSKEPLSDIVWRWLAWHLPRPIVRWCVARVLAYASSGRYSQDTVTDITAIDALERWNDHDS